MRSNVATRKVKGRRKLRFNSPTEVFVNVERLAALERDGTLEQLGNWTLGQSIGHLATWVGYSYEVPPMPAPPLPIRLGMRMMRNMIFNSTMPAGVRFRGTPGGTLGTQIMSTDEAIRRYQQAWQRLEREAPTVSSLSFGMLSQQQAIKLNLRHAELHLSFFRERPAA